MAAAADKSEQFMGLWTRHEPRVFAYIHTLLPHWADAEDVLQNTSIVLWQKLDQFAPGTDFVAWACRAAFFEVQKHRHQQHVNRTRFQAAFLDLLAKQMGDRSDELQDLLVALGPCVDKLGEVDRELIELRFAPGATTQSVAARLQRTVESVYKSLQRVRRNLFECIKRAVRRRDHP